MASSHFAEQPISLAEQVIVMKRYFPSFTTRWHKNVIRWVGEVQPSEISQRYRIKIVHQLHRAPEVFVLKPQLTTDTASLIPHTYPGNRLCLYHPRKQEWSQRQHVATTIVPWTSLWLNYYELWQATGEWLGGGDHPELRRLSRSPIQTVIDRL